MKSLVVVLALSALANVGMLTVIASRSPSTHPAQDGKSLDPRTTSADPSKPGSPSAATEDHERTLEEIWISPTREELPGLIARLRAAGYPPSVIRSLVSMMVSNLYAERRRALQGPVEDVPFWQGRDRPLSMSAPVSAEIRAARRALDQESRALLKELLGANAIDTASESNLVSQRMMGPLSAEKLEQLQAIRSDYADLQQSMFTSISALTGARLPADEEKLALLAKEEQADIRALLTPEEYFEYQLRSGQVATMLRFQLAAFNPTETEFRAIVRAMLDQEGSSTAPIGPQAGAAFARQQQALASQLEGILPADRLADYKVATDPGLQTLARIASRYGLPLQSATEVVAIQREIQQRAASLRGDNRSDPTQTAQQLAALNREATDRLQKVLGDAALAGYREYGGQWLQTLQAPVRPNPNR